jgi:hypothetical protein
MRTLRFFNKKVKNNTWLGIERITKMTTAIFDTLQYAKKAESEGFSAEQAEFLAESLADILNTQIATKADLKAELKDLEHRLTIKFGGMLIAGFSIFASLSKFFK